MLQLVGAGSSMRHRTIFPLLAFVTMFLVVPYLYVAQHIRRQSFKNYVLTNILSSKNNNSHGSRRLSANNTMTLQPAPMENSKMVCDAKCQWEQIQVSRHENLRRECARFDEKRAKNLTQWLQQHRYFLHFVWFSDKHKALYCSVAKAGCTNWKKVFYIMNKMGHGNSTKVDLSTISDIHLFTKHAPWRLSSVKSLDAIVHRLKTYRSFIFAREPFTRVVSAFKDKFENHGDRKLWQKWTKRICEQLNITRTLNESLSFTDFIDYISDPEIRSTYLGADKHWLSITENCFPCQIRYDVIGKLETVDTDAHYTLEQLQVPDLVDIVSERTAHQTNSSDKRYILQYLSKLSDRQIETFLRRYERDYKMFRYNMDLDGRYGN